MKRKSAVLVLTLASLLVASLAFAYGPGRGGGGFDGRGYLGGTMMRACEGPLWGSPMTEGRRGGALRNRELSAEDKARFDELRRAHLELRAALAERPIDGQKVATLQDKVRDLRWGNRSVPEEIGKKMTALRQSALELRLVLEKKPVDEKKASELHEKVLSLRNDIARWRLAEELKD